MELLMARNLSSDIRGLVDILAEVVRKREQVISRRFIGRGLVRLELLGIAVPRGRLDVGPRKQTSSDYSRTGPPARVRTKSMNDRWPVRQRRPTEAIEYEGGAFQPDRKPGKDTTRKHAWIPAHLAVFRRVLPVLFGNTAQLGFDLLMSLDDAPHQDALRPATELRPKRQEPQRAIPISLVVASQQRLA